MSSEIQTPPLPKQRTPPTTHDLEEEECGSSSNINTSSSSITSPQLLNLSFNQDGGCLAIGLTSGFCICNVYPFQETFRRTFNDSPSSSGIGIVEMLFRCNLLALVGGGPSPRYPRNKVMIWDDHRGQSIGELSFRQTVLNVKLRRDRIAVALQDRVYLYNFSDLTLLDQIPTVANPRGLVCLSPDALGSGGGGGGGGGVLACPSIHRGGVRVELYGWRKTQLIDAHESPLAALTLTVDGMLLATASEKGTLVRIFSTKDSTLLHEFRRGVERANISCLSFSLCKTWLGVCSDRGTAHVFMMRPSASQSSPEHHSSGTLSSVWNKVKPWVVSSSEVGVESSYAQIRGIRDPYVCAFVPDRPTTLAVVGKADGSILLADFGKGPGEAERVGYHIFFKHCQDTAATSSNNFEDTMNNFSPDNAAADSDEAEIVFGVEGEEEGFVSVERGEGDVASLSTSSSKANADRGKNQQDESNSTLSPCQTGT